MPETPSPQPQRGRRRWIARVVGVLAAVLGLLFVAAIVALGGCGAYGGTCPADPPPLFDDEVFLFGALGAAISTGTAVFAFRPTLQGLGRALVAAPVAALMIGLLARTIAHG